MSAFPKDGATKKNNFKKIIHGFSAFGGIKKNNNPVKIGNPNPPPKRILKTRALTFIDTQGLVALE